LILATKFSRSLYACQGAVLLVDASQGVEAQTIANFYLAFEQDLTIIPVVNKIDIIGADVERTKHQMSKLFDFVEPEIILVSAKSGIGIHELLQTIIKQIPAPQGDVQAALKALLFDSWFDSYRGVVCLIAVKDGIIKKGDIITLAHDNITYEVLELGLMFPSETPCDALYAGQVGYLITGMKTIHEARIGDTVYHEKNPVIAFPGFKPAKPMVFAGIYPVDSEEFELLRDAIDKLILNDASVTVEKKTSPALGLGFRCGFLGLLHMDVFKQRLEQEYGLTVIATAPSVRYQVKMKHSGEI